MAVPSRQGVLTLMFMAALIALVAIVASGLTGGAGAAGAAGPTGSTLLNSAPGPATTGPVSSSGFRDASSYGVLRSAKTVPTSKADAVPVALPATVPAKAYVFIGSDGPCLVVKPDDGYEGQVCSGPLSTQPPTLTSSGKGPSLVVGLVPDNIGRVGVKLADGSTGYAAVQSNGFGAIVDRPVAKDQFVSIPGFGG